MIKIKKLVKTSFDQFFYFKCSKYKDLVKLVRNEENFEFSDYLLGRCGGTELCDFRPRWKGWRKTAERAGDRGRLSPYNLKIYFE